MINLLPQSEKKKLHKEFYLRYGVVALLFFFGLEIVTFVSFIPSYLALNNSTTKMTAELTSMKSVTPPGGEAAQNDLNMIKGEIALLKNSEVGDTMPSQLMTTLIGQKPAGIAISRFAYTRSSSGISVQINGNADKPEDLIAFRKSLKDDKQHVKDASYAQSFINRKSDIDFLLTVTFK